MLTAIRTSLAVLVPGLILTFFGVQLLGLGEGRAGEGDGAASKAPVTSPEQLTVPDQPGGGVPIGEVDIRVKEGRTNGQREFAGDLVKAAYASPCSNGEDQDEYQNLVQQYVEPDSYYESKGGSVIQELAGEDAGAEAPERGQDAALVKYDISHGPPVGSSVRASDVRGFVRGGSLPEDVLSEATLAELVYAVGAEYEVPDSSGEVSGDVSGEARYYAQELLLAPGSGEQERWIALAGSAPEPVKNPNAGALAPGAPKVGKPGGHGEGH